ncbi:MAG: hypothetical protein ACPLRN_00920 [Microgenomates group bacterium]
MTDERSFSGTNENTVVIEQAKQEIKTEVQNAKTEDQQKELGKKIREKVKRAKISAEEAVLDEVEARTKGRDLLKKEERKQVLGALTQALEAVRQGLPAEYIAKTKEGAAILKSLAEQPIETPTIASTILFYFGDFIFGDKKIVDPTTGKLSSEVQSKFEELSDISITAANILKKSLKNAAEIGQLPSLTLEDIEKSLEVKETKNHKQAISSEAKEKHQKFFRLINEKAHQALKDKKIDLNDLNIINDFLFTGTITPEIEKIIEKIGLNSQDVKTYSELTKSINDHILSFGLMESYAPAWVETVRQAEKEFSLENLRKYFERDEKGNLTISTKNRQILKDKIRRYYYIALAELHQQPSEQFHKLLGEHQEIGYYLSMLRQVIRHSFENLRELFPDIDENQSLIYFLTDVTGNYQSRILSQAEIFHDVPLYVRDLGSAEKILEFLKFIFPTQLAELFHDDKLFLTIARDEMTMLLRQYLVENNNQYDGSLLSGEYDKNGVYWHRWFKDKYIERLKKRLAQIATTEEEKKYLEENQWKINMISTYSEAIGIITLIDGEILATSDPVSHFKNVHPLMSLLSAKHNWLTGRGRYAPGLFNKYLLGMSVDMYPKKRSLLMRLFSKRLFNPKAIKEEIDGYTEIVGGNIVDNIFNASGLYMQLMSMFNLPNSYNSWDGWRIEEIPNEFMNFVNQMFGIDIKKDGKKLDNETWKKIYNLGLKLYGTSFLWWSIKGALGRLSSDIDQRLLALGFSQHQIHEIKESRAIEDLIQINFNNQSRKINYVEFEELKLAQRRAELYFRYLRRNPGDFLMILHQVCPEVFAFDDKSDWKNILLFEFDPNLSEKEVTKKIKELIKDGKIAGSEGEIASFLKKRRIFWERWKGSYEELKRINQWIKKVSTQEKFLSEKKVFDKNKNEFVIVKTFDKNKFIDYFVQASSTAYARLKRENQIIREKILYSNISPEEKKALIDNLRDYLKEEDFEDKEFWQLFAGDGGFFEAATGKKIIEAEEYFEKFGGVNNDGEINLFFNIAHNWFLNNGDINPFAADTPYYEIFKAKSSGEDMLKRTFEANLATFKEVTSKLGKLEVILLEASKSGSLEEIKKLHQSIYDTLSGLVGNEYAWRANYILAQIVANFFAEHSLLRDPKTAWLGPVGWLASSLVGQKNISLSKILTENINAHSMDTNGLRSYFEFLQQNRLININRGGPWSLEQLNRVFETGNAEYIFGEVAPKVLWSVIIFMILIYTKKALEEAGGKKK